MNRILAIARREWLEQVRQPFMVGVVSTLFGLVACLVLVALYFLDSLATEPTGAEDLLRWLPLEGGDPRETLRSLAAGTVGVANFLFFTQFLGVVAVLAGHAVLHDHQCGTLPFLLLAPVKRSELLIGKVLGALGTPLVPYAVIFGGASVLASLFGVTDPVADRLPPAPAWIAAFLLGGPIWACCVASICAIVSTLSPDVRTAQQSVWFVVFFATFLCGYLLASTLSQGLLVQIAVAIVGLLVTACILAFGTEVISRDLTR